MSDKNIEKILVSILERYPKLKSSEADIRAAYAMLVEAFTNSKKLLACGNGGSATDCEHIVAELMNRFAFDRQQTAELGQQLALSKEANILAQLQPSLRAISLCSQTALMTAISNDLSYDLVFAQQVVGYGDNGDVCLGISTSGNSKNILLAMETAKVLGLKTIGLTGKDPGSLSELCEVTICVDSTNTAEIQELHFPVYHALCEMLERHFFAAV